MPEAQKLAWKLEVIISVLSLEPLILKTLKYLYDRLDVMAYGWPEREKIFAFFGLG